MWWIFQWPQKKLNSHKRGQGYISLQGYFWLFRYFWLILRGMVDMVRYQISKIQPKILSWLPKSSISAKNQVDSSKDARELSKITLEGNISLFSFKNPCSRKEVPNWQLLKISHRGTKIVAAFLKLPIFFEILVVKQLLFRPFGIFIKHIGWKILLT